MSKTSKPDELQRLFGGVPHWQMQSLWLGLAVLLNM
jgi:hypothetical protein